MCARVYVYVCMYVCMYVRLCMCRKQAVQLVLRAQCQWWMACNELGRQNAIVECLNVVE